ncbi:AAA family ATPase [Paenibacillus oleatilyticus]|uniref:AAA family ATPase n=1 Tax=Paenibacillus oleatilyticus TaxID=2594886 RepID=A0ABV4VCF0_9BACL
MQIRKAERKKAKLRLGISAPSGAGKTYSSLLIAYGITGDWEKIGLIDTENGSGDLYAHLGDYMVLQLEAPYTPERYVKAIKAFEQAGVSVIIIDSLSHAWAGSGGALEMVDSSMAAQKNKFAAWRDVTPKHNELVEAMLQSKCHIIATMRSKTEYVLEEDEKGKKVPKKVGMAPIQRDGMEYEFTVMLDMAHNHVASASKDRTSLFDSQYFKPNEDMGKKLLEWLETGVDPEQQRLDLMAVVKAKWDECAGHEDVEGFTKWVTETRKKTEDTITYNELQALDALLTDKLSKKGDAANA